jgi:fucose 4-O-acetylase-like acetyltransferase
MSEAGEPITGKTRSSLVDIVKGIAITLVAYGHTAQGMGHRGWWTGHGAAFSDAFVYSFHMPVFFFVAGLFVMSSLERRGNRGFVLEKLKTILYPYVVWLIISACIEPLIGRFKMSSLPFNWKVFVLNLLDGDAEWFLFTLFVCLMLAVATRRVPDWLRFAVAVAVAMLTPAYGPVLIYRVGQEFCFVAAGMWVGRRIFAVQTMRPYIAATGFLVIAALQAAVVYRFIRFPQWAAVILGLTGTAGLLFLCRLLDHTRFGNGWAWLGRASLGIFLLSAFAQGAMRELLLRVGHTHELWLQLLLPTAVATIIPAIIWHNQERWHIGWLFHWPSS